MYVVRVAIEFIVYDDERLNTTDVCVCVRV